MPVEVQIGDRYVRALACASRFGRRGYQILICQHGHSYWIDATRVHLPQPVSSADPTIVSGR